MRNIFFIKLIVGILFFISNNIFTQTKIIEEGSVWEYFDEGKPSANWTNITFSNSLWKKGASPLGYGDDRIKTVISYGNDSLKKDIGKFFRIKFKLDKPFSFLAYELKVQRDDGSIK